jgi:aryl-alcohol dehydrogenase-like predicted oxidoreductase
MISRIRAAVERAVTFFDSAQLYGPFANDGLQMAAGLNETRPLRALPAQINSGREII